MTFSLYLDVCAADVFRDCGIALASQIGCDNVPKHFRFLKETTSPNRKDTSSQRTELELRTPMECKAGPEAIGEKPVHLATVLVFPGLEQGRKGMMTCLMNQIIGSDSLSTSTLLCQSGSNLLKHSRFCLSNRKTGSTGD